MGILDFTCWKISSTSSSSSPFRSLCLPQEIQDQAIALTGCSTGYKSQREIPINMRSDDSTADGGQARHAGCITTAQALHAFLEHAVDGMLPARATPMVCGPQA